MYDITIELGLMKKEYEEILKRAAFDATDEELGSLRTSSRYGKYSYYITAPEDRECPRGGRYAVKEMMEIVTRIARRDYAKAIYKELTSQIKHIDEAMKSISYSKATGIYTTMAEGRKRLVEPLLISDEEYLKSWLNQEYTPKSFQEGTAEIYSDRGERVRSKSEKIIADKLYHLGIPYKYEAPLNLKGLGIIHPDFTIMDMKNRREVYWEHCGIMDNSEYAERAVARINQYERNGLHLGERLILTFETGNTPLDIRVLDKIIERYT